MLEGWKLFNAVVPGRNSLVQSSQFIQMETQKSNIHTASLCWSRCQNPVLSGPGPVLLPSAPGEIAPAWKQATGYQGHPSCQRARTPRLCKWGGSRDATDLPLAPPGPSFRFPFLPVDKPFGLSQVQELTMATGEGRGGERSSQGWDGFRLFVHRATRRGKVRHFSPAQSMNFLLRGWWKGREKGKDRLKMSQRARGEKNTFILPLPPFLSPPASHFFPFLLLSSHPPPPHHQFLCFNAGWAISN